MKTEVSIGKKLAAFVFSDEEKKRQLEQLTTVEVVYIIKTQLEDLRKKENRDIVFVDAPLLFETGADKLTDMVWLCRRRHGRPEFQE